MSNRFPHIAVLPGDGIGPEVMAATLKSMDVVLERNGIDLKRDVMAWPSTAWHGEHNAMMPEDGLEQLQAYDAILLGALGDPGPLSDPQRYVLPDSISLSPLLDIRRGFDLWTCERPARLLKGAPQYLADPRARDVDMLVIRENSEGEYVGHGGRLHQGTSRETATQVEIFTRTASERVFRHAFKRAGQRLSERQQGRRADRLFNDDRGGQAHAQVCLITKRNALRYWGDMYTEIFAEVAAEHQDIAVHHELVDAACMKFVQCPWRFDVVVASNLHGDILTDLAAVLSGGMGIAPSCNINPDSRDKPPMFEPTHGSAPDIAGEGRADPRAMILTAVMLLEWLGEDDPRYLSAAGQLRDAVEQDLANQPEQDRSTTAIADSVIDYLGET